MSHPRHRLEIALVTVLLLACSAPVHAAGAIPALQDEADLQKRRLEWIEQLHRTAPGTDWRAIEAANRLETRFRREARLGASGASPWSERGATNVTGRTWDCGLGSTGQLHVGSDGGGLFRGAPTGETNWTAISDGVGYGVRHVEVLPGSPDRIVIADNNSIHVSGDAGATWSVPAGLPEAIWNVARIVREANNNTTLYALVEGWIWTGVAWDHNWHLLRSTNGGASFTRVWTEPLASRPDLWISRTGAGPLYLAAAGALKKSTTQGTSFTTVGAFPVSGEDHRLAGSEAGAPAFYCAIRPVGSGTFSLFASSNGGTTWANRGTLPDFYGTIHAPITAANQVFIGGVDGYRSFDSGVTLPRINFWYDYYGDPANRLHADIFGFTSGFPPGSGGVERIWIHTDGGTYVTTPATTATSHVSITGFRNAQYYSILTSLESPDIVFAGSQDQGYQVAHPGLGTGLPLFNQIISGDYGHLTSSWPDRSRMVWSVYPGFILVQTGPGDAAGLELPDFPVDSGFSFLPFIVADPTNPNAAYIAARHIWRVERTGPNTYARTMLPHDFEGTAGEYVTAIAIAPSDAQRWYAATNRGRMFASGDAGATWSESGDAGPESHFFYGTDIVVSPTDPDVAWAGGAGYNSPPVWKTTDGGATWSPAASGLGSTLVYGLTLDNAVSQTLFAATASGAYRLDGATWTNLLTGDCCAPLTDYWDVESVANGSIIRFATYGRGIWDYANGATSGAPRPSNPSAALHLSAAPNPVRATTHIAFEVPRAGRLTVEVFDVRGRRVATLLDGEHPAGRGSVTFDTRLPDGRVLDSGAYVLRARAPSGVETLRLNVVR